jgi:hypothetical protein
MMFINLDKNEKIDTFFVNEKIYRLWDIDPFHIQKLQEIEWWFFINKLKALIPFILKRLNGEIDISDWSGDNISQFILLLKKKIDA